MYKLRNNNYNKETYRNFNMIRGSCQQRKSEVIVSYFTFTVLAILFGVFNFQWHER